jgi:arsenate reductase-like glutaredoxin family protein
MLSKEEKREIFEVVMSQLSTVVEELMAKREKNIKPVNEDINDTSDTDS